ncbi:glycine betaine/proline transport system substrate-binding protein [Bisgaardia hudsonensis]|uniref:Glycine betaine/proline transport system substrate-binding protein n=1 Tax=Bisgaardia hudsonensis TaxID=109472 RepID=A0A4V6NQ84_9PAST|nr:glycine betaine ABC transporter substrate-binding protein [Bisgaardia hudsonensis]QLB13310.1 glycine/betaine ABC transporter substrate-binding protein [Bisgaardia hudsonensis]TCP12710.1 glycine betaine/proline transport system substrate-binding protein [Bisgaardia hudsonensis]
MKKFLSNILLFFCFIPLGYADQEPIKFGGLTWESGQFTEAVLRNIVEKGYGYPTQEVSATGVALENALIQNDIQVISEVWMGRSEVMDQGLAQGKIRVVGDTLKGGATQGWYIPDYLQEQYPNLKSISDLSNFSHLFSDPKNLKKSRFLNCPTGWTCEIFNTNLLRNFKLEQTFNNVHPGTGVALDSEISSHYEQKKPLLFYYWQPTGLMAKYKFVPLEFPKYDANCWTDLLKPETNNPCVSGFPVSHLSIAISENFAQQYPDLVSFFQKVQFESNELNQQILEMTENIRTGEEQAIIFLQNNSNRWKQWVSNDVAERLEKQLYPKTQSNFFPEWSLQNKFNLWLKGFVQQHGDWFRQISHNLQYYILSPVAHFFDTVPAWLFIGIVGLVIWHSTKQLSFTLLGSLGLFLIGSFGLWQAAIQTISLMFVSIGLTVIIGIPIGVLLAKYPRIYRVILPLLDIMQTMPSFVYLIPVLMLFGIGEVPAVFACMIYAIVPLIRLTVLGIQQIDKELIETGKAFGSNRWQMLAWIVLPLAKPQIMAGINQTVMMSLSMVVLASMIGASGLGQIILQAIQTLNVGQGLQAGGAIVILAIIVDRVTQGYGGKSE